MMDWNSGYSQSVQIFDKNTNALLDTQNVASYNTGRWLVYTLRGRVLVKFTRTGGSYAQVSGVFFGGAAAGTVSTTGGSTQSATVNTAFATALQVTVRDASNVPVSGMLVTFAAPTSGASAALSSTTATTNAAGVAGITATANSVASAYQVTASATVGTASFSLTNNPGPPAAISATAGTPQTTAVSTAFASPLQITVRDASNNLLSGVTVTFAVPGSGASSALSALSAVTNASGVASVTATANASVGSYNVSASVAGVSPAAVFALTNTATAPASISVTGGATQSATINNLFAAPLQVTVRDAGNNPVSGVTVTFTAPASGARATLSSTSAITGPTGIASVTATAGSVSGSYNVSAAVTGVATAAVFSLTNNPGGPASIAISAGSLQTTVVSTAYAAPLQAAVRDVGGNPVSGVTVLFAAPASGAGATLSAASALTNASGIASITAMANATRRPANSPTETVASWSTSKLASRWGETVAGSFATRRFSYAFIHTPKRVGLVL